ncbi:hypothetical protein MEZE111188_06050 [Mesobacillus zeae]
MHSELKVQHHRPFPLPNMQWLMTQIWEDVIFLAI